MPVDDLRSRLDEIPRNREIAAYCQVGQRGYLATRILRQKGFSASNIGGGYKTYKLFQPNSKRVDEVARQAEFRQGRSFLTGHLSVSNAGSLSSGSLRRRAMHKHWR